MKKILFCLLGILLSWDLQAQNPSISNQVSIGGSGSEELVKVIPTGDGFFLLGMSDSPISGNKTENSRGGNDLWFVKTDLNYAVLWDKTIGGSGDDKIGDALLIDNRIYVALQSDSPVSGEKTMDTYGESDIWLLCLDLSGNIIWQNQFGGTDFEGYPSITQASDTTLIIVSSTASPISGNKTVGTNGGEDVWLIEVSLQTGNDIQQHSIGSANHEGNPSITKLLSETGYILRCDAIQGTSGDKTDPGYGASDIWLVELDNSFNIIQDKCFGGNDDDYASKTLFFDNTFIYISVLSYSGISGNKTSPNYGGVDCWLLKLDQNWNLIWEYSYGGSLNEAGSEIYRNSNGKLVLSGNSISVENTGNKTAPKYGNYDLWLLILNDEDGSILTQETYGGYQYDAGFIYEQPGSSNQLLLQATSQSPISGNKTVGTWGETDFWLANLDASDFLHTVESGPADILVTVYPNPFSEYVQFDFDHLTEDVVLSVYGADGKLIREVQVSQGTNSMQLTPTVDSGLLMYTIQGATIHHAGKIVRD